IAIIITIMVLELKVPQQATLSALVSVMPIFVSCVLSFLYVALYWNNHHHFFHLVHHVDAAGLWANMNLLFWLFWCRLPPVGWARTISRRCRLRRTVCRC